MEHWGLKAVSNGRLFFLVASAWSDCGKIQRNKVENWCGKEVILKCQCHLWPVFPSVVRPCDSFLYWRDPNGSQQLILQYCWVLIESLVLTSERNYNTGINKCYQWLWDKQIRACLSACHWLLPKEGSEDIKVHKPSQVVIWVIFDVITTFPFSSRISPSNLSSVSQTGLHDTLASSPALFSHLLLCHNQEFSV